MKIYENTQKIIYFSLKASDAIDLEASGTKWRVNSNFFIVCLKIIIQKTPILFKCNSNVILSPYIFYLSLLPFSIIILAAVVTKMLVNFAFFKIHIHLINIGMICFFNSIYKKKNYTGFLGFLLLCWLFWMKYRLDFFPETPSTFPHNRYAPTGRGQLVAPHWSQRTGRGRLVAESNWSRNWKIHFQKLEITLKIF